MLSSNSIDSDFEFSRYNSPSSHFCKVSEIIFSASLLDKSDFSKKLVIDNNTSEPEHTVDQELEPNANAAINGYGKEQDPVAAIVEKEPDAPIGQKAVDAIE